MENTQVTEQPTDKKAEWAELSDEEETDQNNKQPKNPANKKKKAATNATKPAGSKITSNVFVCNELEVDDDEDEPEQAPKKEKKAEGPSMKDFVAGNKGKVEEKVQPQLSKKEQKKKELEDFDKILNEFKGTQGTTTEAPAATETQEKKAETPAEAGASAENAEAKKKKKAKKAKKEGEKEGEKEEVVVEETKQDEAKPNEPIDVEKKIQEIMKNKAKANQPKKVMTSSDIAKQEILARQQNAKKTKKKHEDL